MSTVQFKDLNLKSKKVIRKIYCALLRARDRMIDMVTDDDEYRLDYTTEDIEELVKMFPWLPENFGYDVYELFD